MTLEKLVNDVIRVTEAAAICCVPWVGRGDKHRADEAATAAMRQMLANVPMSGTVVIGEGEMDEAPMLYIGEHLGKGGAMELDVAVDPLEGTNALAAGARNALCVIALGEKGSFLHAPDMYMDKLAVGAKARGRVHLDRPIEENVLAVAEAENKPTHQVIVAMLDRPRHASLIRRVQNMGASVTLISDGDIVAALGTSLPENNIDLLIGRGGSPEGVLAAAGLACLGGEMQARLAPETPEQIRRCRDMGVDPKQILSMKDLIGDGDVVFVATGVTDGDLLRGVHVGDQGVVTHSLAMVRSIGSVRFIQSLHADGRLSADPR